MKEKGGQGNVVMLKGSGVGRIRARETEGRPEGGCLELELEQELDPIGYGAAKYILSLYESFQNTSALIAFVESGVTKSP